MEATDMMYRDGWYYLLGTHGTCCDGPNSSYNIRVGRSRSVLGPYVDNMGIPLLKGGGKLVAAGHGRVFGIGHFGLLDLGDGVQKFSMHYEADMDRSARSVLDIRPLLWKDGWPVGGDNFQAGTYEIESERSGFALELAVDFVRINTPRRGFGGPPPAPPQAGTPAPSAAAHPNRPPAGFNFWGPPTGPVTPIPDQTLEQDSAVWPSGNIGIDLLDYMIRPHQKWTITPVPDAGGYPGSPYFDDAWPCPARLLRLRRIVDDWQRRSRGQGNFAHAAPEEGSPTTMIFFGTTDRLKAMGDGLMKRSGNWGTGRSCSPPNGSRTGSSIGRPGKTRTTYRMDEFLVSLGYLNGQPTIKLPD